MSLFKSDPLPADIIIQLHTEIGHLRKENEILKQKNEMLCSDIAWFWSTLKHINSAAQNIARLTTKDCEFSNTMMDNMKDLFAAPESHR